MSAVMTSFHNQEVVAITTITAHKRRNMQKRSSGPCPIFSMGQPPTKRPRQALFTHPNNIMGKTENAMISGSPSPLHRAANKPSWTSNSKPGPSRGNQKSSWSDSKHYPSTLSFPGPSNYQNYKASNQPDAVYSTSCSSTSKPIASSHWGAATPAAYVHPSNTHECIVSNKSQIKPKLNVDSSSALKPVPHTKKPVLPRVITTTAHGLLQWSLVLHQQIVTFEIFGIVNSQVSDGDFGSKQFSLKTSDGIIKCYFWEMDRQLPRLVRGKLHRAMGCWDVKNQLLKCVSIRIATQDEDECLKHFITTGNTVLRELIALLHEH